MYRSVAWTSGELERVRDYSAEKLTRNGVIALMVNGFIAFLLNVVSFSANKKTSALTMTVAANVKQVLTVSRLKHYNLGRTDIILCMAGRAGCMALQSTTHAPQQFGHFIDYHRR